MDGNNETHRWPLSPSVLLSTKQFLFAEEGTYAGTLNTKWLIFTNEHDIQHWPTLSLAPCHSQWVWAGANQHANCNIVSVEMKARRCGRGARGRIRRPGGLSASWRLAFSLITAIVFQVSAFNEALTMILRLSAASEAFWGPGSPVWRTQHPRWEAEGLAWALFLL